MRNLVWGVLLFSISICYDAISQIVNTATMDTLESTVIGHLAVGGYLDTYYGYNFSQPQNGTNPYFVSSNRHDEMNINLAYLDLRYKSTNFHFRFVPGYGTYMNANYANEVGTLKNIVEANAGIRLSAKRSIWLDIGVFGSPYTNESAISKDHLMYTRSFAPENVPYYLSGLKVSVPLTKKWSSYFFLLNGWQVIQSDDKNKAIGTQVEYRPNKKMLFNWDTYIGSNKTKQSPDFRMRYFTDVYWIYKPNEKWDATAAAYIGFQERVSASTLTWWQLNFIGRYHFTELLSLSGRIEYYEDEGVSQRPITSAAIFRSFSSGLCLNYKANYNALVRVEGRQFVSPDKLYLDENTNPSRYSFQLVASVTAWF
jgi:Putative beta-barrel porin-2, OmpL-like. bbp2